MITEIDGIAVSIKKKPIKNMYLRIYPPDGRVHISAPLKQNILQIHEFVSAKSAWIKAQQERIKKHSKPQEESIQTGQTVAFKGQHYLLITKEQAGPSHVVVQDQLIYLTTPPKTTPLEKQRQLDLWYRKEMATLLPDLIQHWQRIIGVQISEWGIKKMKTRWGSCNTRVGRIWLNLNLIKKPLPCLEYVLVHELIHLLEPSHNKRFYALMEQFMPLWRDYQRLLEPQKAI